MSNKGKGPTEDEFLAHEAEIAKAALTGVKTELIESFKAAADPKAWAEKYPLPALGTAAAGGFAAAAAVKPMIFSSKDHHDGDGQAARGRASRKSSNWSKMLAPLMNVAKSSIKSAIIAGITAKAATDAAQDETPPESPADAAGSQHVAASSSAAL